jgi:hypothetical protein
VLLTLRITRSEKDDVFILVVILAVQEIEVQAEEIDGSLNVVDWTKPLLCYVRTDFTSASDKHETR